MWILIYKFSSHLPCMKTDNDTIHVSVIFLYLFFCLFPVHQKAPNLSFGHVCTHGNEGQVLFLGSKVCGDVGADLWMKYEVERLGFGGFIGCKIVFLINLSTMMLGSYNCYCGIFQNKNEHQLYLSFLFWCFCIHKVSKKQNKAEMDTLWGHGLWHNYWVNILKWLNEFIKKHELPTAILKVHMLKLLLLACKGFYFEIALHLGFL